MKENYNPEVSNAVAKGILKAYEKGFDIRNKNKINEKIKQKCITFFARGQHDLGEKSWEE